MARPHPSGNPLAALTEAQAVAELIMAVAEAARDGREENPGVALCQIAVAIATYDFGLREAWTAASDGGRRDVMTTVAELAARAGADPDGLDAPDDATREAHLAGIHACSLLALAAGELADPTRTDPDRSLLPDAPWEMATGPTGIYAMSVVCDSTEPEAAKLAATVALSAAASTPKTTGDAPR